MSRRAPVAYRAVLRCFPPSFRREYGRQIEDVFVTLLARCPRGAPRVRLWIRASIDLTIYAGVEWMKQLQRRTRSGGEQPSVLTRLVGLAHDARYAVRGFRRSPGYAAAFVITLGLGIGANTAIFSVVNGVMLRPLPYDDGDAIVRLEQRATASGFDYNATFSIPEATDYQEQSQTLGGFAQYSSMTFTLLGYGEPRQVRAAVTANDFFRVMGLDPVLGRTIQQRDDAADAGAVAVLSHEFWTTVFGTDSTVLGTPVEMNDRTVTVVGVLEPIPQYPSEHDIFVNLSASPHHMGAAMNYERAHRMTEVFARLQPGVTLDAARRELNQIAARLHAATPDAYPAEQRFRIGATRLRDALTEQAKPTLIMIMATAGFVLLIACANVANLTLTRLVRRERELAVRCALGAGTTRLRGQLLVENLLLSFAGAGLGVGIAVVGMDLLVALAARYTPLAAGIGIDGTVLFFAVGVAVFAAFLFAWGPGLPMIRHLNASLSEAGGRASASVARRRVQRGLVIAQLAVSFVLLIGASLLVRTLVNLNRVDPGFDPENVLTMTVPNMPGRSGAARAEFFDDAITRIEDHPAVRAAAVAMVTPLRGSPMTHDIRIEGRDLEPGQVPPSADFRSVSFDYFRTVGMPLVRGRTFTATDHADAPPVVVLSQTMADYYFPNESPVGRRIAWDWGSGMGMGPPEVEWKTVVGVVADTRDYGLDQEAIHTVYQPYSQEPFGTGLLVRTVGDPTAIARDVTTILRGLDPNQPIERVATMEQLRADSIAPRRINAVMLGAFALLALVIAGVGVAGVLAFSVSQRTHEFGIRLTLGARRSTVLRMVLSEGAALAAIGLAIGGASAVLLGRFVSALLFDVSPTDPMTYAAVAAVLVLVTLGSAAWPARRATRVDPISALRAD